MKYNGWHSNNISSVVRTCVTDVMPEEIKPIFHVEKYFMQRVLKAVMGKYDSTETYYMTNNGFYCCFIQNFEYKCFDSYYSWILRVLFDD